MDVRVKTIILFLKTQSHDALINNSFSYNSRYYWLGLIEKKKELKRRNNSFVPIHTWETWNSFKNDLKVEILQLLFVKSVVNVEDEKIWQEISFFFIFYFSLALFLWIWCWITRTHISWSWWSFTFVCASKLQTCKVQGERWKHNREKRELYIYVEKNNKALNFYFVFFLHLLCNFFFL